MLAISYCVACFYRTMTLFIYIYIHIHRHIYVNSGWPSASIWRHRSAWRYQLPSHCLNQYWLLLNNVWCDIRQGAQGSTLNFPQLGSRTTIKQNGLVRNRNLLGHDDNILPFSTKNRGELYICISNFYFKITVSEAHCHIIDHWCSLEVAFFFISVHFDVAWTRNTLYKNDIYIYKCITLNILIQNVERIRMHSLYWAHVMSCHCCMFAEHYHFNIFGIEWDRNITITVISDHLIHAQGRWLVYFSFTNLNRRPNGHVTAASYYHLLTQAIMPILNWLEDQIKLLICLNHSTQHDRPKYSTLN